MSAAPTTGEQQLALRVRVAYAISAILLIAMMGGAVYGWPTMRPILRRDNVLLPEGCMQLPEGASCDFQEMSFGLIFTIGSWSNQGGRFLVGIALDRFGPRRTSAVCAALCALGAVLFGALDSLIGLATGFFLIGVGGAGMQLSLQSVSALFPKNKALVMSSLSGAFQAASGVFLIMDSVHRSSSVSRSTLLYVYAGLLIVATAVCAMLWPEKPFGIKAKAVGGPKPAQPSAVPLSKRSFREQALSPEYLTMVAYFSLAVLQAQFMVGTVGVQFELMGDSAGTMARIFNLCFSLSWTSTPFIGFIVDRLGVPLALALMNSLLMLCPILLMSKTLELQPVLGVVYALARVSIWAIYFSFMGATFGFANFGKLAGMGLLVASCLSLLQYALLTATLEWFQRDFFYVNALFVIICLLMYPLIALLRYHLNKPQDAEKPCKSTENAMEANTVGKCADVETGAANQAL